jgi:hypothetical protein
VFERTREKLSKLRKKISTFCSCCNNNNEFINEVNNNIELESNDSNQYKNININLEPEAEINNNRITNVCVNNNKEVLNNNNIKIV